MIFFSLLLYDRFLWYTAFLLFLVSSCEIFASISCRFPFLPDVLQIDKVPSHKIRAFRGKSVYTEFQSRTRFNFTEWTPKILPIPYWMKSVERTFLFNLLIQRGVIFLSTQKEMMSEKKLWISGWSLKKKKSFSETLSLLDKNLMPVDVDFFVFRVEQLCPKHTAGLPLGGPS